MSVENYINRSLNPNRIPLIHNYCDKWCERCTMTSRCAVYEIEREEGEIPPLHNDEDNEEYQISLPTCPKIMMDLQKSPLLL